jgi:predicted esterase
MTDAPDSRREMPAGGPHQNQPVWEAGADLSRAKAAMVMLHGRDASARSILTLADEFARPDVAYRAPQAGGHTWYPRSFLAPLEYNEPGLASGLGAIWDVLGRLMETMPSERIALLGFSQGACLALEYTARHPMRYGGVIAFSGGLIGSGEQSDKKPPDDKLFEYDGDLGGTPVFLGCSDRDSHIPLQRVEDSATVFRMLGAEVDKRIYEGMGHTINEDEVAFARGLLARLAGNAQKER